MSRSVSNGHLLKHVPLCFQRFAVIHELEFLLKPFRFFRANAIILCPFYIVQLVLLRNVRLSRVYLFS